MPRSFRRPSHAGSWYESSASTLADQIQAWTEEASVVPDVHARAIIAPHAGYSYCGHVMAFAYKQIDPAKVSRVFLLGPSHHVHTEKCVLSRADSYRTPLGDMEIDMEIYSELKNTGMFETMDMDVDEAEHSLELHTPYIVHTLRGQPFKLVPIMVGSLSTRSEAEYGRILGPYLNDSSNLFVVSSDFCHWGTRFRYTLYDEQWGPIWKYIEWLDHEGMKAIETGDARNFKQYLRKTDNTICGRHPISVFMNMLDFCDGKFKIDFTKYDQSSHCRNPSDSSVSYASAIVQEVAGPQ
ncbi:hypothetical protein BSKO_00860 [Bryopsis sp. KO-2023]|nr:hypothetical protein BSKO_00860 [Bryopsis sp. KO-2023]